MAKTKSRGNGEGTVFFDQSRDRWIYTLPPNPTTGKRSKKSFKTQKEANQYKRETLSKLDKGQYIDPSLLTVSMWCSEWLETYCKTTMKPSTYDVNAQEMNHHIIPALGKHRLQQLKTHHVQAFCNGLSQKLAPKPLTVLCGCSRSASSKPSPINSSIQTLPKGSKSRNSMRKKWISSPKKRSTCSLKPCHQPLVGVLFGSYWGRVCVWANSAPCVGAIFQRIA